MHLALLTRPIFGAVDIGGRRLLAGATLGIAFALSFHLSFVGVAHGAEVILEGYGYSAVEAAESPFGSNRRAVQLPAGPAQGEVLPWMEPFWAALSAALGQCLAIAIWALPDRPVRSIRDRQTRRHRRYAVAHSLLWLGVFAMMSVRLATVYIALVFDGSIWRSIRNLPHIENPFTPLAAASALAILVLTLAPWQGLSLSYRCRWWPVLGAIAVATAGGVLLALGRWVFAGVA